jgi:hypothetical protein
MDKTMKNTAAERKEITLERCDGFVVNWALEFELHVFSSFSSAPPQIRRYAKRQFRAFKKTYASFTGQINAQASPDDDEESRYYGPRTLTLTRKDTSTILLALHDAFYAWRDDLHDADASKHLSVWRQTRLHQCALAIDNLTAQLHTA